jgi:hypothetical protein
MKNKGFYIEKNKLDVAKLLGCVLYCSVFCQRDICLRIFIWGYEIILGYKFATKK